MIKAVFCTQPGLPASYLISWATKEPWQETKDVPSHVAFVFNVEGKRIVVDSSLLSGVREWSYVELVEKYHIIEEIDLGATEEQTYRYLERARKTILGKWYDFLSIIYFSWRAFLYKFFRVDYPKKNLFNVKDMFFCTEVYKIISGENMSMVSPNQLYLMLKVKAKVDLYE